MTDTTSPPASPFEAVEALARHVELRDVNRSLALAFLFALQPERDDRLTTRLEQDGLDLFSLLVASKAFGEQLDMRLKSGEPNVALAFLHLLLDRNRLMRVIDAAGLQPLFMTFDRD